MKKRYRKNVAAFVTNSSREILACRRSDVANAWQAPQGGIERGETDEEALARELAEEIGLREFTILAKLPFTICYDWPERLYSRGYHGQEQRFFLVEAEDSQISLNSAETPEFDQIEWVSLEEFVKRVAGFRATAYRKALEEFSSFFSKSPSESK